MRKLAYLLKNLDFIISSLCLTALIIVTFLSVLSRYLLNSPFAWTEEVQMMLIVWTVFMGGSMAFREKAHIAIEVLVDALPAKARRAVRMLTAVMILIVLIYIGYQGAGYIGKQIEIGRVTSILKIPGAFIYSIIPIGSAFMAANFIIAEVRDFRKSGGKECGAQ